MIGCRIEYAFEQQWVEGPKLFVGLVKAIALYFPTWALTTCVQIVEVIHKFSHKFPPVGEPDTPPFPATHGGTAASSCAWRL